MSKHRRSELAVYRISERRHCRSCISLKHSLQGLSHHDRACFPDPGITDLKRPTSHAQRGRRRDTRAAYCSIPKRP